VKTGICGMQIFAAGRIIATAMVDPNLDERFERDDCFSFHSVIAFATLVEVENDVYFSIGISSKLFSSFH
jgi:hypothetical protein